jgi:hypothetical protein
MKRKLLLCCVSIVLLSAGVASAKSSTYENLASAANWSSLPATKDYKNILAAAKWSRSPRTINSNGKTARLSRMQDAFFEDDLFGSSPRSWATCFRVCVRSGMEGTSTLCLSNCMTCGLTGAPWGCAICLSCGTVGGAAVEFCALHCCVNPGCPAGGGGFPAE